MENKLKQITLDLEKIISIQEKIIKTQDFNIKKEMKINELLYDRYLDVRDEIGKWKYCYMKLNQKWVAAGIYVRDRRAYMREYMKKKRANGEIKHWRKYIEEKGIPIKKEKEKTKYVEKKKSKNKKDPRRTDH